VIKVNYLDNSLSYYTFNYIWIVTVNPSKPASDGKEIVAPVQTAKASSSEDATVNPPQSASEEKIGKEASASEEKIDAPVSTTITTVSENTGIQVLITAPMRHVLESELGYHRNEVDDMHPQVK
jgi:hypothetical protein